MDILRRKFFLALSALLLSSQVARAETIDAPNFVPITPLLATSGQPSERALKSLSTQGFQAVIYLAPSTVPNAVPNEGQILSSQGIEFVHIPIPFGEPTDADVQAVFAALHRLKDRKVLVHCEINMRASTMTFLYRTLELGESPDTAYDAVRRVWTPRGVWGRLVKQEFAKKNIQFELY